MHALIANRGEIATRIARTARELGVRTTVVYACDDRAGTHLDLADHTVALPGTGPAAYLDSAALLAAAAATDADAVHPGYGFLSESAEFAGACATAGLTFVGPHPETLLTLGDKVAARAAATAAGLPVLDATAPGATLDELATFLTHHREGIMLKALAGGGGRGMRAVHHPDELAAAYRHCGAEALAGFGDDTLFAEAMLPGARHIEVQVVGDGTGVTVLGDRDCSVQRRHQKLIEIAPAQGLPAELRRTLHEDAARLAGTLRYHGLGTVEFLVRGEEHYFLEVNPRIQVEHTVTEAVTGLDLVAVQFGLAGGASLAELGLGATPPTRGVAVEARVNAERADGELTVPSGGTISVLTPPVGLGVRVDTHAHTGLTISARYDSLLAKVIVHSLGPDARRAFDKAARALAEFTVEGVDTNLGVLRAVLTDPEFTAGPVDTGYFARRGAALSAGGSPLPVRRSAAGPVLVSPMPGVVVEHAEAGREYRAGEPLVIIEAMKMRHVVAAPGALYLQDVHVAPGDSVDTDQVLATYRATDTDEETIDVAAVDLDAERADLAAVRDLHHTGTDAARPQAVARRHALGRRTARENIADLVDPGSFREYGPLVVAAQSSRRSAQELRESTPADGLVAGLATVDGAPAVVMSYDYTVLAGTQGARGHAKTDRMLRLAHQRRLPVFVFPEGGGGRPGDVDAEWVSGLDILTFHLFGALRGRVPLIAVVSGRCFAGNAALAGMCDVVIATPEATIGMGGPAMIEGGGLGQYRPEQVGPVEMQRRNGVIDVVAQDEADAVRLARLCFGYHHQRSADWTEPDPRASRFVVPEDRLLAYDVRAAVAAVADVDSVVELRPDYARGMATFLVRVGGRPYGLVANDCRHLGGAIHVEGAVKLRAFLELCDSWRLPVISFCDTPGFMVGPESERDGAVRAFSELFAVGARLTVPIGTVILRKAYGLGAQAMSAGSFHAADFVVAWPTGEVGMMGLEGAVRLGFRRQLDALTDPAERQAAFDHLLADAYAAGRAANAAAVFEIDDVIDPAETRHWIGLLGTGRARRDDG